MFKNLENKMGRTDTEKGNFNIEIETFKKA